MATKTLNVFDDIDTFILCNRFTLAELRREINNTEVNAAVAGAYRDTPYQVGGDVFPWDDYAECCRKAIKWQQQKQPKQTMPGNHIDVEAIKAKNDIVAIIEGYTRLRKTGRNFTGCCPIHGDKHPSLTVYPEQQSWHCYGCNRGGDVFDFIQAAENTDFRGAAAILGGA